LYFLIAQKANLKVFQTFLPVLPSDVCVEREPPLARHVSPKEHCLLSYRYLLNSSNASPSFSLEELL
jgi:hypothetical protein